MRMLRKAFSYLLESCTVLFTIALVTAASAVTMDWSPVGNPGNACDAQPNGCFGDVDYAYRIGTYEVTNAQYAEFLNAKAVLDPFGLYHPAMGDTAGGIARTGAPGGPYTYTVITGREQMPVTSVSFYDALRFANWMNNGQGSSDTETGSYSMLGEAVPSNGPVTRNAGAWIVVPSEDEWYKAAYFNGVDNYFNYPAGSSVATQCVMPTATANRGNCNGSVGGLTAVGSYPNSPSPYGTFDQGGNLWEWNEAIVDSFYRGWRGGAFDQSPIYLNASERIFSDPTFGIGFRLVMIPEPGTGLLLLAGLLGLVRRPRA
jgi:formylglycine-generating enzyme required for sulfatase activity